MLVTDGGYPHATLKIFEVLIKIMYKIYDILLNLHIFVFFILASFAFLLCLILGTTDEEWSVSPFIHCEHVYYRELGHSASEHLPEIMVHFVLYERRKYKVFRRRVRLCRVGNNGSNLAALIILLDLSGRECLLLESFKHLLFI